jgi:hypothetical protein
MITRRIAIFIAVGLSGCTQHRPVESVNSSTPSNGVMAAPAARQPFFGDLHLHTTYSYDAWGMIGTRTTPEEAYQFAQGEPVSYLGQSIQRREPLDFMAVTDHSEYIGVLNQLDDQNSALLGTAVGQEFLKNPTGAFITITRAMALEKTIPGLDPAPHLRSSWERAINAANRYNRPGKFTTFIGYEWTSMPEGKYNLHRNVLFNADTAPVPFTALDSKRPEDLWAHLDNLRRQGIEVIAIPHNANASGGRMFDWVKSNGQPIDQAYALERAANEPLTEIVQIKGQSETIPELSASDEFADFEVMDRIMTSLEKSSPPGSYVRDALGRGLVLKEKTGSNPFKLGFVGGTDIHNGLSTSAEDAFAGGNEGLSPERMPAKELARARIGPYVRGDITANKNRDFTGAAPFLLSSGGLTGVWAEANTRGSIFAALRRKETFATSGTRMRIRLFGGWNYSPSLLHAAEWLSKAYADGVTMGGDLPLRPAGRLGPRFVVTAAKDPNGANLDRLQIIKVWGKGGAIREKVFDVAWSDSRKIDPHTGKAPSVGNTVNLRTATYTNSIGASQLATVWTDPEFDAATPAVYYARALEIPTPRWSTLLAVRYGLPLPTDKASTLQERAWSSPIWYDPQASAQ